MALSDQERLIVSLEARVNQFEKAFQRANKTANDNFGRIEKRAKESGDKLEKSLGGSASKVADNLQAIFSKTAIGVTAVAGAAMAMRQIANSIAEVEREARKAGVSARVWQQWSHVATATGMSIDGVTDAMKELNIRGDEFALTGKGSAAEAFERLGYTAADVAAKLQDPNRFLDEIIGKVQKLDRAAQTRILDEIFGGTGAEQLAKVLGMSVAEIQHMRNEAATFTDEQIEAAKKIDREFNTLWRNVTVYAKQAAIEGVNVAKGIISALRGEWLPGYDQQQQTLAYYSSDEYKLKRLQEQREATAKRLAELEGDPDYAAKELNLTFLRSEIRALDDEILKITGGSDEFKDGLKELSGMSQTLGGRIDNTALSTQNFKTALDNLKALVPDLKQELDQLAKLDAVEAAFQKVAESAGSIEDVISADAIAARARSIIKFGAHNNILDLIGAAEGTDKGRGYNETLGYGAFTGGAVNLTGMTLNQVLALQKSMLAHPDNKFNSSAVGRYQVVRRTLLDAMKDMGLTGDRLFDEDTQDEIARYLLRRRGNDTEGLRNEWEGLRQVDDATITNAYHGTPIAVQQLPPTAAQQQQIELTRQQTEARQRLNQAIDEGLSRAQFEQSIAGISEERKRIELQLYDYVAQARRDGINLTDQEIQKMREKIAQTQQLNDKTRETAQAQQHLGSAGEYFGQTFTSALSGLLTGTQDVDSAVRSLINSLIDAALQAALLGKGPLAGLFGGMGSGILGAIFGFSEGGAVELSGGGHVRGPGTSTSDSIPARLSNGEYVVRASQASKHRPLLEAINSGRVPAFAEGGSVGKAGLARSLTSTNATTFAPSIAINVEGGSRGREADQELAGKIAEQAEIAIQAKIQEFAQKQMMAGGMFRPSPFT